MQKVIVFNYSVIVYKQKVNECSNTLIVWSNSFIKLKHSIHEWLQKVIECNHSVNELKQKVNECSNTLIVWRHSFIVCLHSFTELKQKVNELDDSVNEFKDSFSLFNQTFIFCLHKYGIENRKVLLINNKLFFKRQNEARLNVIFPQDALKTGFH